MHQTSVPSTSQLGSLCQAEASSQRAAAAGRSYLPHRSRCAGDARPFVNPRRDGTVSLRTGSSGSVAGGSVSSSWRVQASAVAEPDVLPATEPRPFELEWPEGFHDRFTIGRPLGCGSFGTVNVATDVKNGKEYAVKVVPKHRKGASEQHILQKLSLEAQIMTSLSSRPECVRLHGLYQDAEHVYMVTELCTGGDLESLLKYHGRLTEKEAGRVVHDVLSVLAECHHQNICYADVKPANFLLKRGYPEPELPRPSGARPMPKREIEVKVVDFGCSTFVAHGTKLKRRTGTPIYMAPELFMRYYGMECDLWALGMLTYQLLSGRLPFWGGDSSAASPFNVMVAILHQEIKFGGPVWEGISADAKDLVTRLLDRDYNSRITAAQALQHPWMKRVVADPSKRLVMSNVVKLKPRRSLEGESRPMALPL